MAYVVTVRCPQVGDSLFVDLPRVRLDGGVKAFRQRWGYELQHPPTLMEEDEDGVGGVCSLSSTQDPEAASIISPIGEWQLYSTPRHTRVSAGAEYRQRTPHRARHRLGPGQGAETRVDSPDRSRECRLYA